MRAFRVVDDQVVVQVLLHLFQSLVPLDAPLDAEVFVQQRAIQSLDEPVALRLPNSEGAVLDALGVRSPGPREHVDQPIGALGLIVAKDLLDLLPGITYDLAGLADDLQIFGQFHRRLSLRRATLLRCS